MSESPEIAVISEGSGALNGTEENLTADRASNADATNAAASSSASALKHDTMSSQQQQQPLLSPKSSHPLTSESRRKKQRWTDTNSDKHCIQNTHNPLARLGYSISLATGFYAVEPLDKRLSLVLGYSLLAVFLTLITIFIMGVRDGIMAGSTLETQDPTDPITATTTEQLVETVVETATAAAEQIHEALTEETPQVEL